MSTSHDHAAVSYDYVIVGGGLCGVVVASRLSVTNSVLLIEAGNLPDNHPLIGPPLACFQASKTELDWNYTTVPQRHVDGKKCYASGGRVLSGGTAINRGTWSVGSSADYDEWARLVDDDSYSFQSMQKYFEKTQIHHEKVSKSRLYPLREQTRALLEQGGIPFNPCSNSGSILGFEEYEENWKDQKRQLASTAYNLSRVKVMHDTQVIRVILDEQQQHQQQQNKRAIGVETKKGEKWYANREVILSAGAYRTPHLLLHSGIGPVDELQKHDILVKLNSPFVGLNFHDHFCSFLWWKVKDWQRGVAMGSASFSANKSFQAGLPADWIMWQRCPTAELQKALEMDKYDFEADSSALLNPNRAHAETIFFYSAPGGLPAQVNLPTDGTLIGQSVFLACPSSRGSIQLSSNDPNDDPKIDPNYYSTQADKIILQTAMRQIRRLFLESPIGKEMVEKEYLPIDIQHCTSDSMQDLDARIKRIGGTLYHAGGSASMGKVVDSHFKIKGLDGIRIIDASVIPLPLAAHSQACLYAIAEKAADIILCTSEIEKVI